MELFYILCISLFVSTNICIRSKHQERNKEKICRKCYMEMKNNKFYTLKLHVFLLHPVSIFSQEKPQTLFSSLGSSVCTSFAIYSGERSLHLRMIVACAYATLPGLSIPTGWSQLFVLHVK